VSEPVRILIADDQALVRGGLRMILDAQPDLEVVGEAADGREALQRARAHAGPGADGHQDA
jgi:DNA-binding NarL/FixJ family response regulator